VVQYFEIVKEKWPEQEISFDQIVKVGAAYHEIGEYERAYLIFRATVQSSFSRESGVAGFLDEKGEFLKSVEVMERLLSEYPPEPYLAAAQVDLSQRVYAKAPEAAADPKLQEKKINRIDLIRRALGMLETMLTEFPDDPAADQAAFSAANALLDMKDFARAAAACDRYARRYPKSQLLDSFWYVTGYCRFATGRPKEAMEMCRKVAEAHVPDPQTGRLKESPNKWRAIFILGQIYHSLGQAADAVREYRRVEDRFNDARRSIDYFLRKSIELPEVTTFKPGEPVEVDLKFRNLAACDVKVYRVDLMKFGLLERNLGGITRINLAGIRPQFDSAVPLGDGKDYRDRTHRLPLPLKKEGAYLVVCRGENLHSSGLVLVTPLGLEVQADPRSGQVRATVKDLAADRYLGNVEVKIIGSLNEDFVSGTSDLRGVFVAEGVRGVPTVIAELPPGRYAFFRGQGLPQGPEPTELAAALPREKKLSAAETAAAAPRKKPAPTPAATAAVTRPAAPPAEPPPAATTGVPLSVDLFGISPEEKRIRDALKHPTVMEFTDESFANIIEYLKDYHKIQIQFDQKALEEVGFTTDKQVTINLKDVSLRSALKLLLRAEGLTYMIRDDVLLITTPDEAANKLTTMLYPVADLVVPPGEAPNPENADFDSLIDLVTSTIQPTTWDAVGGPGCIAPFQNNLTLVVSQTEEVHEELAKVLTTLRSIKTSTGGPFPVRRPAGEPGTQGMSGKGTGARGGMGGMMGGVGGMGGTFGGPGPAAKASRGPGFLAPAATSGAQDADLLGGLQQSNQSLQRKHIERLKGTYQGGMGGVGAGAAY
jgi:TolA-binding protein